MAGEDGSRKTEVLSQELGVRSYESEDGRRKSEVWRLGTRNTQRLKAK
ncbi:MAG: hypothetical protein ACOXZ9_03955 [Bacteroidales bacterium]